jgi:two-component system phosphate regulon sensor histidine kinase PhoR
MKKLTYKSVFAFASGCIALMVVVILSIYFRAAEISTIFFAFIIGGLTYFIFIFINEKFILKEILSSIKDIRKQTEIERVERLSKNTGMIAEIHQELVGWSEDRKNEVGHLRKLENYRKEFLGNVSHELKTPIFNIEGYICTLLDGGLDDPGINKNYLERALKSVDRMISIVRDLESIAQLEKGELQMKLERFEIVSLVKEVFDEHEMEAKAKSIKLLLINKDDRTIEVLADKDKIRQVLTNLVINSIRYGKKDGETHITFYDMGENISVEVIDNGIGIPQEYLDRIFERFYRVDKGRSRDQGGTGLGLSIVKHIIEAHAKSIKVFSIEGAGTTFSFSLKKA